MEAILVERDYKGEYERYALTPEEFKEEYPDVYKKCGPIEGINSVTLSPMIHITFERCTVGGEVWNNFFTDMKMGLPDSDIESGNLAYIRQDLFQSLKEYLPGTENTKEAKFMKAINIMWDVDYDGDGNMLPNEIEIPKGMTDEEEICEYLSEVTGYCHEGFKLVECDSKNIEIEVYPHLSLSEDYEYLKENLSAPALVALERILDAYDKDKIDFELKKDPSGYTAEFCLIINDKDYSETGLEAVALKWSEAMESTEYLVDSFSDTFDYNSYRFTVDYSENGVQKSFQIGIAAKEKPDSKWLAQKISNYFSAHYNGSVEKAINSVEGIDVFITDYLGEYVDSDEIYGDDLKDLFEHLKTERYKLVVDDEIHYAVLTSSEVNRVKKDIAGELHCQFEITDENGEKIESGIIDSIEKVEKPGLDSLISGAQQKADAKKTWIEEKREELSQKPRSEWTEEDWEAHNYCENVTAEADYFDSLDDR